MDRIGYTLSRLLEERDLKPADLSRMAGVERAHVTVYTSGRKAVPKLDMAAAFCDALGIGLDCFWDMCKRDFRTEGYRRWLRIADMRYKRGEFAEQYHPLEGELPDEKGELVAGEGVEPPTQGFSESRRLKACPLRSYSVGSIRLDCLSSNLLQCA